MLSGAPRFDSINIASKTILAGGKRFDKAEFWWLFLSRQPLQNRVPGNACERRRGREQRAGVGAAVEKIEEKRQPEDFFGHRKRGCKATSSPSAPASEKALKPLGFRAFSLRFRERRTVCFAPLEGAKTGSISHPAAYAHNDSVCTIIKTASKF